ncbi:MAG TPA: TonB family protein [Terriglobales bacterium]|jgi:TonB family protein|nr:TonB family protein [Terriglobales bacterium]
MSSILTPPDRPAASPSRDSQLALWDTQGQLDAELTPHLLIQLEDDLERARMREAFWISVVVHLMVVLFLFFSPKMFPWTKGVVLISPQDLMRNQQMTYLDLPPDMQKEPKVAPKTDVLSDKNRTAESRHPTLDKKTLEELKRAGPPKIPAAPAQQAQVAPPPQPAQQAAPQQQQNQSQNQQMAQLQPALPQNNPRLPSQQQQGTPKFPNLGGMMSPGSSIEQAARAVASRRGGGTYGTGGDYGVGPGGTAARVQGNLEVLSDTQGVDFGPYLSRVLQAVRMNWYNLIPEEARPPLLKKGKVSIEFVILKDGKVAGMRIVGPSGDVPLDRAAWGGITASVPFAPLPSEFHGPYLALRFHFYYNPGKGDIE